VRENWFVNGKMEQVRLLQEALRCSSQAMRGNGVILVVLDVAGKYERL